VAKHRAEAPTAVDFDAATEAVDDVTGDYALDPAHTRIGFRSRHAMVTTVRGHFTSVSGTAHLDSASPGESWVRVDIDTASVDTGQADRDGHLTSADFFDAERHPRMTFASTAVEQVGPATYRVTGDLTVKDVTRSTSVDFEMTGSAVDPFGNLRVGFEGVLVIQRSDWGLTWNAVLETGGVLVSDKVQVEFDVSAIRQG
jgi:polyisoprenoid-binding protein YceI